MPPSPSLQRVITLPLLILYGLGTILGAGIYALGGKVAGISGIYAPVSFLLSSVVAGFIAFSYAELCRRYPKSAGEAYYVNKAFSSPLLTSLVGWGIVLTGIVSSGVMARGFHGYMQEFFQISDSLSITLFIASITIIAVAGVSLSAKVATIITLIEISGLVLVLYATKEHFLALSDTWTDFIPPFTADIWLNIMFGAFLAFYAYIGFEDMVNIAEEVIEPERNLPIAITAALLIATLFYVLTAFALVLSLPIEILAKHNAPFALIIQQNSHLPVSIISLISLIAIFNGALVQIVMGSRVLYGLAEGGIGPEWFAHIHPKTQTPVNGTVFFSFILLLMTLWLPIISLAKITSFIILIIFALVNLSLCSIKIKENRTNTDGHRHITLIIPAMGFFVCLGFMLLQLI